MARNFRIHETILPGLKEVERSRIGDERGFLSRLFCNHQLVEAGFVRPIMQINQTLTHHSGSVRGMHYQRSPHAEDKFVSVLRGEVFDVAVDIRTGSSTFLQWHGVILSAENARSLFIPTGFAHGFQTLQDDCELIYLHTASYQQSAEGGVDPFDPALGIQWPLRVTEVSARDRSHARINSDFRGIVS